MIRDIDALYEIIGNELNDYPHAVLDALLQPFRNQPRRNRGLDINRWEHTWAEMTLICEQVVSE